MNSDIKSVSVRFSSQNKGIIVILFFNVFLECSVTMNKDETNTISSTAHVNSNLISSQIAGINVTTNGNTPLKATEKVYIF